MKSDFKLKNYVVLVIKFLLHFILWYVVSQLVLGGFIGATVAFQGSGMEGLMAIIDKPSLRNVMVAASFLMASLLAAYFCLKNIQKLKRHAKTADA